MDEDTCNFYQYNLGILPYDGKRFAVYYLKSILNIFAKNNNENCINLIKTLNKQFLQKKEDPDLNDKAPEDIVKKFEMLSET